MPGIPLRGMEARLFRAWWLTGLRADWHQLIQTLALMSLFELWGIKMNFLWSASNNSFFPEPMAKDYESVGWDLSDAIPVDAEVYAEFTKYNPRKVRIAGNVGMPAWKDLPPPTHAEQVACAEAERQNSIESANGYMNSKQWPGKAALGRLKGEELNQYNLWLDYLDALSAVDTSTAPDIEWPVKPE